MEAQTSTGSAQADASGPEHVLLFSALNTPQNSRVQSVLDDAGFQTRFFCDLDALVEVLKEGAGALIVEEEAITERAVRLLSAAMSQRAPWSNLPIIVLTDGDPETIRRLDDLDLFGPATSSNVTILERPLHEVTIRTVVRSALRARRRQYEVRDLLAHLEEKNEELRKSQRALQQTNETLEERVSDRTEQVRELALALTTAEQRERSRISEILHDHLQQLIHGARIWAETMKPSESGESPPEEALDRILDLLGEALETTRSLSVELSPPVLRSDGLLAAFQWLAEYCAEAHALTVTTDLDPNLHVTEEDLRTLLFRTTRELLYNVVKHAEVDAATLRAHQTADRCVIEVIDEGVGFDVDEFVDSDSPDDHFGLFSVRERLDLVGGTVSIDSAPGKGTHICIEAPISED